MNQKHTLMNRPRHVTILGGGPAGLAVGYYAKKNGLLFTIYEAKERVGGNCVTFRFEDFFFDSGAHRFHGKDKEATKELSILIGQELKKIYTPSHLYHKGKFIIFPFTPLDLATSLGPDAFLKACAGLIKTRLQGKKPNKNFETFALFHYGPFIAKSFLLNYSEKLWGLPSVRLSPHIAHERLKGLDLKTFLLGSIFGRKNNDRHLEGSFYYPAKGIGVITKRLAEFCKEENIQKNARVTKIIHHQGKIRGIEINGNTERETDIVVNTLPLDYFLQIMRPQIPGKISSLAQGLRWRATILAAFFLNAESATKSATLYFPDPSFLFTRIYEPKNRSSHMSPAGKTSLVAEIPCQEGDNLWNLQDNKITNRIRSNLIDIGLIKEKSIIGSTVKRLEHTYPMLEVGYEKKIQEINLFLKSFGNLTHAGRNGRFKYAWVHDMLRDGREIINQYIYNLPACLH